MTHLEPLRILVVDDTALYRKILTDVLAKLPGVEVVGTAQNGKVALGKIAQLRPDLITLDVEMPEINGLETLRQLKHSAPTVKAIMVSTHTSHGAKVTMEALALGAFDFIAKPDSWDIEKNIETLQTQLHPIIAALSNKKAIQSLLRNGQPIQSLSSILPRTPAASPSDIVHRVQTIVHTDRVDIVAIGISTGGPKALVEVIPKLPRPLGVPVVIVQHMPPLFTAALAESLNQKSALTVVEDKNSQVLEPDMVYIAPGGKQMKIVRSERTQPPTLAITDDPPENHCKPSVDYLFRSIAQLYASRALGVIMTGMGADGVLGLRLMKRLGAQVLAQDEASCVVFGMPMEAIKAGVVDVVLPLDQIAEEISRQVRR
jgi:two-component system chemotaxis response regulator CheB